MEEKSPYKSPAEVLYQTQWEDGSRQRDKDEEEKHFSMLMESLGANSVFEEWAVCVCELSTVGMLSQTSGLRLLSAE